jgi:nitrogen fixation NifU-like protein
MNDLMKKHFLKPMNLKKPKFYTHTLKNKSGFCGDTIELYVNVKDSIVTDIGYNVFGCYAIIAAASILSEWAMGKSTSEVSTLSFEKALNIIGEVESEKHNCVNVVVTAFQQIFLIGKK